MAELVRPSESHFVLDGTELVKARERLGLSQGDFADGCGWTQQYQSQLESPEEHEISLETAKKIKAIIP